MEEPTRKGALLDLMLMNTEELVRDMKVKESFGCNDYEMMEFKILREGRREKSKTTALGFRRADFILFRVLLGRIPWAMALKRGGVQESWLMLSDHFLQAQERTIPTSRKSSQGGSHG